jgi:hypothetical protein
LCLISFISISFLWSQDPQVSVDVIWKELIPMFLLSLYLASRFTIEQQFSLTVTALIIAFLFSSFLAVALPSVGTHQEGEYVGSWKGAFGDKNRFGAIAAMTMTSLYILLNYAEEKQRWAFIPLVFCFATILLSGSVTALVLSSVCLLLTIFHRRLSGWANGLYY